MLSSRGFHVVRWGHCWIVLCVIFESRWTPGRVFALPVRLYFNKKSATKWNRVYRKKTDLMLDMQMQFQRHVARSERRLHFLADSSFTVPALLQRMPQTIAVTSHVMMKVRVHQPPPAREPGQTGRPRRRGDHLSALTDLLQAKGLRRLTMQLDNGQAYKMRVAEQTGRFYNAPDRDVKVVVTEHLRGGRGREAFYTTEVDSTIETILRTYSWRWSVEVTFQNTKQHLGVGQPRNRKTAAVGRTAATGFLLYSLIIWWHERVRDQPAPVIKA